MIPENLCGCGCGGRTTIAKKTCTASGRIKGRPSKYIRGHHPHPSHVGFPRVSAERLASSTKTCIACKKTKTKDQFYRANHTTDGFMSKCKVCADEYHKKYSATPSGKASVKRTYRKLADSGYYQNLECRIDQRYRRAAQRARDIGRTFTVTFEEYVALLTKPCEYCGLSLDQKSGYGLDRLNNSLGYTRENVVQCCSLCNTQRSNIFTPEEMRQFIGPAIRKVREGRLAAKELVGG